MDGSNFFKLNGGQTTNEWHNVGKNNPDDFVVYNYAKKDAIQEHKEVPKTVGKKRSKMSALRGSDIVRPLQPVQLSQQPVQQHVQQVLQQVQSAQQVQPSFNLAQISFENGSVCFHIPIALINSIK